MATAAPNPSLPLLYQSLEPINFAKHGKLKVRPSVSAPQIAKAHAVPVTIDEFSLAQRFYPIVFTDDENPVPIALMGLNEGTNVFFDDNGRVLDAANYIPAYIRRYPFILVRTRSGSEEMSLCLDPQSDVIGDFPDGQVLFEGNQPSGTTKAILGFCEQFEEAAQRTSAFLEELKRSDLLVEGEVSILPHGFEQPFVYHGFRQVDEEKLRNLSSDDLRRLAQNGTLPLIFAHLFSLPHMRTIFALQLEQGKVPSIRAGRFLVHGPGSQDHQPGTVPLKVAGGPAFGTGQHATTSGCLAALDALKQGGRTFENIADIGTGSGLLAFAALKLWPEARCIAADIDPAAIEIAGGNAAMNDLTVGDGAGQLLLEVADGMASPLIAGRAPFDLIVANVLAEIQIELAPAFGKSLAPGGTVMLAGLIERQMDAVIAAYEGQGFEVTDRGSGDWPVMLLTFKPGDASAA